MFSSMLGKDDDTPETGQQLGHNSCMQLGQNYCSGFLQVFWQYYDRNLLQL